MIFFLKQRAFISIFLLLAPLIFLSLLFKYNNLNSKEKKQTSMPTKTTKMNESYVLPLPSELKLNENLRIEPIAQYEFNLDAPNSCGKKAKRIKIVPSYLECKFPKKGLHQISTFICDKKKTICFIEDHFISVK